MVMDESTLDECQDVRLLKLAVQGCERSERRSSECVLCVHIAAWCDVITLTRHPIVTSPSVAQHVKPTHYVTELRRPHHAMSPLSNPHQPAGRN